MCALHPLMPPPASANVCVIADRLVNSVCLQAVGSQGVDLFLRLEAEATRD